MTASAHSPRSVAFFIKTMSMPGGGAERVLAQVATGLADRGHAVTIVSRDRPDGEDYYPSSGVARIRVGGEDRPSGIGQMIATARQFRAVTARIRPQVAVGFMHSSFIPLGLGLLGTGTPVIASEHTVMAHYRSRRAERLALLATPALFSCYTVVSDQSRATFHPWLRRKMEVVPNPLAPLPDVGPRGESERKILASVGRLDEAKGHATLIAAFAQVAHEFPEWDLWIAGDGELKDRLRQQITNAGMVGRIELLGPVRDIHSVYARADLFATASRYESFGLATAEALAHGIPAIGFADCPGTNELIIDRQNGLLVTDTGKREISFATALRFAMGNNRSRNDCGGRARASVARYEQGHVVDQWARLLESVAP